MEEIKINIVDAPPGTGKTQAAINFINSSPEDKKFIYITPYLDEVNRVINACADKKFVQPIKLTDKTPKMVDLKNKLAKDRNIATTHAMFHLFDEDVIQLCYAKNYTLIMDEVTDVVEPYDVSPDDKETLFEKYVDKEENGVLRWRDDAAEYHGVFKEYKRLVKLGCLADYGGPKLMIWLFPVKTFTAFRESYILTYLFDAQIQKYYYDFYNLKYDPVYVTGNSFGTYAFTREIVKYKNKYNYKELINVFEDEKLNQVGDKYTALSKNWYDVDHENGDVLIKMVRNNALNFFKHKKTLYQNGEYVKSSIEHNLWTTYADYRKLVGRGTGFSRGFESCNARATNKWMDRTVVAYLVNRFVNPVISKFFAKHGIIVDEEKFALSEMLQFIWRSAIRKGEHITVYVPSRRMRTLLIKWINENSAESEVSDA